MHSGKTVGVLVAMGGLLTSFSSCTFVAVTPGICTSANTILNDSLLGEWVFDFGFATRPVRITRPTGEKYHLVTTNPGADPVINFTLDFRLCKLAKGTVFVEMDPRDGETTIRPLRLVPVAAPGVQWMFETVDANRADFSGLTTTIDDPSGPGHLVVIGNTGAALVDFLNSATYEFSGFLRMVPSR